MCKKMPFSRVLFLFFPLLWVIKRNLWDFCCKKKVEKKREENTRGKSITTCRLASCVSATADSNILDYSVYNEILVEFPPQSLIWRMRLSSECNNEKREGKRRRGPWHSLTHYRYFNDPVWWLTFYPYQPHTTCATSRPLLVQKKAN